MSKRSLTAHEYKVNSGAWTGLDGTNSIDNRDGTYTIIGGLNMDIPISGLQVRVKAMDFNPASASLYNAVAYTTPKKIQAFFIGDSITMGVGTTGTGFPGGAGVYAGADCFARQTISKLSALDITPKIRGFSGQTANWFRDTDLSKTIQLFDLENYTDVYCVLYFGTNDMAEVGNRTALQMQADITALSAALKAAGAKVIIVPPLDVQTSARNNVTYNSRRAVYNVWLIDNYASIADGLANTSVYPDIYADFAANNATYFADVAHDVSGAGKLHPTSVGAELLARACADAIITLSATSSLPVTPKNEAADFIAATGITDSTIIAAITTLVSDLKTAKLWHRLYAIYPFVGGTADTNKYNLRDARDLDAAYRLLYTGTPVHDANGITWASGAYADTNFKQTIDTPLIGANSSLHYYSRTTGAGGCDIGVYNGQVCWLGISRGGGVDYAINVFAGSSGTPPVTTGLFCASRSDGYMLRRFLKNGVSLLTTADQCNTPPDGSFTIGDANIHFGMPSPRNCAYAAIGAGLTDAEEAAHYTIVQAFQTALGRAV